MQKNKSKSSLNQILPNRDEGESTPVLSRKVSRTMTPTQNYTGHTKSKSRLENPEGHSSLIQ